jgi:nicotinamidase-related amidase
VDISHPLWWKDGSGYRPQPFSLITPADVEEGTWTTTMPALYKKSLQYLKDLDARQRYPHVIWPEHCRIGTIGATVVQPLQNSFDNWERNRFAQVDFVTKGSNPYTEHFSGVLAEVPDPTDPTTQINTGLIQILEEADIVLVAGEARSHCLANTVRDIVANFNDQSAVEKLHLLTDACSDVPTFEQLGEDFVKELTGKGMKTTTTVDFLK